MFLPGSHITEFSGYLDSGSKLTVLNIKALGSIS
jgi:hypothetical protein